MGKTVARRIGELLQDRELEGCYLAADTQINKAIMAEMDDRTRLRIQKNIPANLTRLDAAAMVNRLTPMVYLIEGDPGSGKTTLLNCLAGLDRPTSGSVKVLGHDLMNMSDQALTEWRREQIGLVFQSFGLIPTLSAYENIDLMLRLAGSKAKERHRRALELLHLVGLQKWADHRPYEMSGGQQQRVAVARALANHPKLILADEPNIREVIAFPKSQTARDLMADAPSTAEPSQLKELHLKLDL